MVKFNAKIHYVGKEFMSKERTYKYVQLLNDENDVKVFINAICTSAMNPQVGQTAICELKSYRDKERSYISNPYIHIESIIE